MHSTATFTIDEVVAQSHLALNAFAAGDPEPLKALYSRRDDAVLANPFGPPARGWPEIGATMDRAATHYREGHATGFETLSRYENDDLACMVEIERYASKIDGGAELAPVALRVTTTFRREDGEWRIVHRHADPTVSARPADVVLAR